MTLRPITKKLIGFAILAIAFCTFAPTAPSTEVAADQPAAKPVAFWIKQLDSDRFVEREDATRRLSGLGIEVVDPLAASIREGNRETISRGAYVLYKLAMHDEGDAGKAAYDALREMLESEKRAIAGIARKHVDQVHITRQKKALNKLIALGAEVKDEVVIINPIGQPLQARTLEIGEKWRGEETDLLALQWLYDIRNLSFRREDSQGSWLQYAARMDALERLAVRGGQMGDSHLQLFMQKKEKLRILELKYVQVSDASIASMEKHLTNAASLKLYGTKITMDGAERLRNGLPKADIDYRRGGFLGVGCQTHPLGCHISEVRSESSADKAELRRGDVIVRYDGELVTTFEELTRLISKNVVGQKVRIEVARNVSSGAIAIPFHKDGLKIKSKRNSLGLIVESMDESSPLQQPDMQNSPFPGSISPMQEGDIIVRINGEPVPQNKSADEAYFAARELVWKAAYERVKQQLDKGLEPKTAPAEEGAGKEGAGKEGDEEDRDAQARRMADKEAEKELIQIQYARGGEILVKDVVLGAWD